MTVARIARRHYAIEHVDTACHRLHQIARCADAHQIVRTVLRQLGADRVAHFDSLVFGLTERQTADRVSREADLAQLRQRRPTKLLMHPALVAADHSTHIVGSMRLYATLPPC